MGIFGFFKEMSESMKNTDKYGHPIDFLQNVTNELRYISQGSRILVNNPGRLKIEYKLPKYTLKIDYIYMADHIQVSIEVLNPNLGTELFECNYNEKEVESLVMASISHLNNGI